MSQTQCIGPLKQAMQTSHEMVGVGCEALNRLFSSNQDQLVKQVCVIPARHKLMDEDLKLLFTLILQLTGT